MKVSDLDRTLAAGKGSITPVGLEDLDLLCRSIRMISTACGLHTDEVIESLGKVVQPHMIYAAYEELQQDIME